MTVQITTVGQGPDLVLLHGWGMHAGVWEPVRDALARHVRLHLVDLPGYGGSPALDACTLERLVDALAAATPASTAVCGWSLGAQVALAWAHARPDQVRRLALVAATPCFVTRPDWPHGIDAGVLSGFGEALARDHEGTLKRFISLQAGDTDEARAVARQLRSQLFARGRPSDAVLQAGLAILLGTDLRSRAAAIGQPTFLCHGARDTLTPAGAARWLAETLPDARLHEIADGAHAPFLSHPALFVEHLTEFLDEH